MFWFSQRLYIHSVFILGLLYYVESSRQRFDEDYYDWDKPDVGEPGYDDDDWEKPDQEIPGDDGNESDDEISDNDWENCPCGSRVFSDPLIINGQDVNDLRKYPWTVSVYNVFDYDYEPSNAVWGDCGAAIIYPRYVLTAAHCFEMYKSAHAFKIGLKGSDVSKPSVLMDIEEIIMHPEYDLDNHFQIADIALVKLKQEIPCSEYNRPICLPKKVLHKEGDDVFVSGWGFMTTDPDWIRPSTMQEAKVKIVGRKKCPAPAKDVFCTLGAREVSCSGDSGSPLMMDHGGKFYAIGVSSHIFTQTCEIHSPAAYVDVTQYISFIKQHIQF